MKKSAIIPLFISLMLFGHIHLNAQCTPGPQTEPGFFPTTAEGIHPAAATEQYNLEVTIVVPSDTVIPPFPPVAIDSATVNAFIGFPAGFQVSYNTPSGWVQGGAKGCLLISGTPTLADTGVHQISFVFTALVMGFAYTDTITNYWTFEIKDDTHVSIRENQSAGTGSLSLFPNPAKEKVQFVPTQTGAGIITLTDITGREILRRKDNLKEGMVYTMPLEGVRDGVYLINVRYPSGASTTGKLVVNR